MGLCTEFGPHIHPGCDHAMVPGADQCYCPVCSTACTGRFAGCAAVWARAQTIVLIPRPSSTNGVTTNGASRDLGATSPLEQSTSVTFDHPVLDALKAEIALLDRRLREVSSSEQATCELRVSVETLGTLVESLPNRMAEALANLLKRDRDPIVASVSSALNAFGPQIVGRPPERSEEQGNAS